VVEKVKLTIELPKALVDFIQTVDTPESLEKYLENHIVETMQSYVELLESSAGILTERLGLKPVFKEYGVLPSYVM